jgi:hypothetical protein
MCFITGTWQVITPVRYVELGTLGGTRCSNVIWHAAFGLWRKKRLLNIFVKLRNKTRGAG